MKFDKREVTEQAFCIPVDLDEFKALVAMDDVHLHEEGADMITLSDRLDKLEGVRDTDYNGHFGASIYLKVEMKYDTPELWAKIEQITNDYLEGN